MINLFTYGSLMSPDIMYHVAGSTFEFVEARLTDYLRSRIHLEEYPAIIPKVGEEVGGIVYQDIHTAALQRLDLFEGRMYERKLVEVLLSTGNHCQAMAYILKPEFQHILTLQEWNYNEFLMKGKTQFLDKYFGFRKIDKTN